MRKIGLFCLPGFSTKNFSSTKKPSIVKLKVMQTIAEKLFQSGQLKNYLFAFSLFLRNWMCAKNTVNIVSSMQNNPACKCNSLLVGIWLFIQQRGQIYRAKVSSSVYRTKIVGVNNNKLQKKSLSCLRLTRCFDYNWLVYGMGSEWCYMKSVWLHALMSSSISILTVVFRIIKSI